MELEEAADEENKRRQYEWVRNYSFAHEMVQATTQQMLSLVWSAKCMSSWRAYRMLV